MWFFASGSKKFVAGATIAALAATALMTNKTPNSLKSTAQCRAEDSNTQQAINAGIVIAGLATMVYLYFRYM
jgi:hypothetical protein